jgi:hypothetical protein
MARETEDGQVHEKECLYRSSGTRSESTFEEDVDIDSPFPQKQQWRPSRWVVPYIIFSTLVIVFLTLFIISHSIRSKQCDTRRAYCKFLDKKFLLPWPSTSSNLRHP